MEGVGTRDVSVTYIISTAIRSLWVSSFRDRNRSIRPGGLSRGS